MPLPSQVTGNDTNVVLGEQLETRATALLACSTGEWSYLLHTAKS